MEEDITNKLFSGFVILMVVVGFYYIFINKDPVGNDAYGQDEPSCDQFSC